MIDVNLAEISSRAKYSVSAPEPFAGSLDANLDQWVDRVNILQRPLI